MDTPLDANSSSFTHNQNEALNHESSFNSNVEEKIELVSEELNISKKVETHTRLFKKEVVTEEVNIPIELLQETIEIERVPINMEVESFPEIRHEGDITIIPIVREEAILVKKLILVEEIKLTKRSSTETQNIKDTVRKEIFNEENPATNNTL